MSSTPKLTKRQRKGIAFRELRSGKGKAKKLDDLDHNVPILEVQDLTDSRASGAEGGEDVQDTQGIAGGKGKRREKVVVPKEGEKKGLVVATKRKREEAAEDPQGAREGEREDSQSGKQKVKRRKGDAGDILEGAEEAEEGETKTEKSKQRFILFLGMISRPDRALQLLTPYLRKSQIYHDYRSNTGSFRSMR
jgi:nucleolar protein 6